MSTMTTTGTKQFLYYCFPSLASFLPAPVLDIVWPSPTQCPTPSIVLFGQVLRWPNLIPACGLGALVGFAGGRSLGGNSRYGKAFFYFGVMNSVAFLTHCVFPVGSFLFQLT